ncbi:MAG: sodium:alanine symporter family protein, partial [Gammaproteobacteria bacterium]
MTLQSIINTINGFVWGPVMLVLILGTGLYLSIGLRGISIRKIGYGFRQLFIGRRGSGEGDISPFNALMTSLSATVGTGNIVGVATAVGIGGP